MSEYDPIDVEDIKKRRGAIENRYEERVDNDLRRVLATAEGRRIIWMILGETRILRTCFDTNNSVMSFNEGKRDIGLFMTKIIEHAKIEAMEQMRSEAASDRLTREAELLNAEKEKSNG